ncbi:hypothetical protein FHX42_005245 [Saccharopolyspora lacisalsi]|uniref:FtsK domain-containing protein n=1 Tax=Halosaccharopolyspora lacisalsi TaxID=1000566 RepID=A0A839EAG7_9PSEU|nr:hypothetical protein [Halosaccharopolyspora lacisalsi]MBA8827838.1 hypothetical protein [Halosaccharopolyspora lacisalsi]
MGKSVTKPPKPPTAKKVAREHRKHDKKQDRKQKRRAWLKSRAHQNRHHGVPLAVDATAVLTGCVGHYADPTTAVITGAVSAATIGVPVALGALSERERGLVSAHGLGAAAWAVAGSVFGPVNTLVSAAGAVGAITAQVSWIESRKVRTTVNSAKIDKKNAETWNGDGGVLSRVGMPGAGLFATETVWSADGQRRIGMNYHIDLAGSGVRVEQALQLGPSLAAEIPGRLRQGAVTVLDDEEDTNHVIARVVWVKPWSEHTKLEHPIVTHLDEIRQQVNAAVEYHLSDGATGEMDIPDHIKHLLPNMSSIKNPFPAGEIDDGSTHYKEFWRKGYGSLHGLKVGFTGSGKTVDINSEITSLMPCRDALVWVIDVSMKAGKDFAAWGDCIDWMGNDPKKAAAMLRQAIAFADGRGKEYRNSSILSPATAPAIVILIDELSALWKQLPELCSSMLTRGTKEFRSQGIILRTASQRGSQEGYGHGFAEFREMLVANELLKVKKAAEAAFTLSDTENLPGNPEKFTYGEAVEENSITGKQVHRKGYFVDIGDDEDEDDHGVIPELASLYGPFRPTLDAPTMKYATPDYLNRTTASGENPLITPEMVTKPRTPEPITTEDELAEHVEGIRTNTEWLGSHLSGDFRINTTGPYDDDTDGEDDDMNTAPEMHITDIAKKMGITTGDDEMVREQRAAIMQAQHDADDARRGDELADLDRRLEQMPAEHANKDAAEAVGQVTVKQFPDDDPIKAFCVQQLGKASTKGIQTGEIAARYAEHSGKKAPSKTTVVDRLKDLNAHGKAKAAGSGRGVKWFRADQAPEDAM